jgi:hypothetical protein
VISPRPSPSQSKTRIVQCADSLVRFREDFSDSIKPCPHRVNQGHQQKWTVRLQHHSWGSSFREVLLKETLFSRRSTIVRPSFVPWMGRVTFFRHRPIVHANSDARSRPGSRGHPSIYLESPKLVDFTASAYESRVSLWWSQVASPLSTRLLL